jgi:hypothetical protein
MANLKTGDWIKSSIFMQVIWVAFRIREKWEQGGCRLKPHYTNAVSSLMGSSEVQAVVTQGWERFEAFLTARYRDHPEALKWAWVT